MSGAKLIDTESLLSENEEWMKLEEDWKSVDLETEEDQDPKLKRSFSTLDLRESTFDSSFLFKKVRRKVGRQLSKASAMVDYKDFITELEAREKAERQFYFINGQIISAVSVEEICNNIDEVFKSIEKLASPASTMRKEKAKLPERVECSISTNGLSFDETPDSEREKHDSDDIDRFIDEAFGKLSYTMLSVCDNNNDAKESVTTLVKRFSSILNNPTINCSPRRRKQCCSKFKQLADFWEKFTIDCGE